MKPLEPGCSNLTGGRSTIRKLLFAVIGFFCLPASSVFSQVLVITPICGTNGTMVTITGSGWREVDPPCHYEFYFDGMKVAPDQPNGVPPAATFTVPANAAVGDHCVRVELRIDESNQLVQSAETKFKVVGASKDPWAGGANVSTEGGEAGGIRIVFDPKDACNVSPCKKIVMIQVVRNIGQRQDGTERVLSATEINLPNGSQIDMNMTTEGYTVDYQHGDSTPYYNNESGPNQNPGRQSDNSARSIMVDDPGALDANYPSDIVTRIYEYEVGVFCAEGHDAGQFFGSVKWRWVRSRGGTATASVVPNSLSQGEPSMNFMKALEKWTMNQMFPLPGGGQPTTGGPPCN